MREFRNFQKSKNINSAIGTRSRRKVVVEVQVSFYRSQFRVKLEYRVSSVWSRRTYEAKSDVDIVDYNS